ncbi:hypothetical protein [Paenarthrobacter nicotinovorans]|uniref:hypothetical protein n=1 Tax=Paenarthrobacter nicotinovorans TaxID=29320 RepID=UPI00047CC1B1|nr:hypothetical protein [Paenarthrobacter nicotinovorans]
MTTTVGLDEDENRASLDVGIELTEISGSEGKDDAERVLTYTGSVSLLIIPAEGFNFSEGTDDVASIVTLAWPYARTSLIEHAQRLGAPPLRLPPVPEVGKVEPIDPEADVKS